MRFADAAILNTVLADASRFRRPRGFVHLPAPPGAWGWPSPDHSGPEADEQATERAERHHGPRLEDMQPGRTDTERRGLG
jgi:hypothetical protein